MSKKIIEVSKEGKQALSVSIRKWERVVKAWEKCGPDDTPPGNDDGIGSDGCGLCTQYLRDGELGTFVYCDGCPVSLDTGEIGCINTPYDKYEEGDWFFNQEGAQKELDYLRDLDSRCVMVPGLRHNRVKK